MSFEQSQVPRVLTHCVVMDRSFGNQGYGDEYGIPIARAVAHAAALQQLK